MCVAARVLLDEKQLKKNSEKRLTIGCTISIMRVQIKLLERQGKRMKTVREFVKGAPSWVRFSVRISDSLPFSGTSVEIVEKLDTLNYTPYVCEVITVSTAEVHLNCK